MYFLKYILGKWEKHYINESLDLASSHKNLQNPPT